jgi:hypothetical protein
VPSFGSGPAAQRGRRGGGNAPPPGMDQQEYLRDLQNQIGMQGGMEKQCEYILAIFFFFLPICVSREDKKYCVQYSTEKLTEGKVLLKKI